MLTGRTTPDEGSGFRPVLRQVMAGTRRCLQGRDLALASAGATLFGAFAGIPTLLVAIGTAGLLFGRDVVLRLGSQLAQSVPNALGAAEWVRALFDAGLSMSIAGIVFATFIASAYGRGLSRALRRFAPAGDDGSPQGVPSLPPSWWSRAMSLPALGLAPLLLLVLLMGAPWLSHLSSDESPWSIAAASYLSLNLVWVITWAPLTWAFRVVAPGRPTWRAAIIGGVVTGAFVSGFLQGFVLFLALPIDLARPFGGIEPVGVTVALLLWLWVLHAVFCVGYAFTWAVDAVLRERGAARSESKSEARSESKSEARSESN